MSDAEESGEAGTSIFLSYSRADREQVLPIIEALEAEGYSVWWDGLLKGGDRFLQVTEKALETSDIVLVMWTQTSVASDWVRDEATRGRDRQCLISVSLDGCEPPLGFRQIQYIDVAGNGDVVQRPAFAKVLEALRDFGPTSPNAAFTVPSSPLRPDASPATTTRRGALIGGGAAIIAGGGALAAWQSGVFGSSGEPNSLAVMNFENLSNDPEQDYFSAGLSEELRSVLSLNRQLSVAAQTSSTQFSEADQTSTAIANALGVANVLVGNVRRAADRLRITVRLNDGATGRVVWSDQFDRKIDDVLTVQTEIAAKVVDSLIEEVTGGDAGRAVRAGGTQSVAALDAFLLGMDLYENSTGQEKAERAALAAIDRAIEIDPQYGAAYAARSRFLTTFGNSHASGEELSSYYDRAKEAAIKAVEIAPDLAEGHLALGAVLANAELDIAAAKAPYERSFDLGYGNARVLISYALFASFVGTFDQGRSAMVRAERLDPLNARVFRTQAVLEFAARDYNKAATAARRALSLNKNISIVNRILGDIARLDGRTEEARGFYETEPSTLSRLPSLAILEAAAGNQDASQQAFDTMIDEYGGNSLYQQAQVYAQWGQAEAALEALELAYQAGDAGLVLSRSDQNLDPIRQTAKFESIQQRLGFV